MERKIYSLTYWRYTGPHIGPPRRKMQQYVFSTTEHLVLIKTLLIRRMADHPSERHPAEIIIPDWE